jgi:RNA-directed DNA polymerase
MGAGKKRASNLHAAMTTRGQSDADNAPPRPRDNGEAVKSLPRDVLSIQANEQKESPGQNDRLMEQVADPANLNAAWKRVRENGGAPGIDGITVEAFLEYAKPRAEALRNELLEGSYRPHPLRRVAIPKPSGGGERLLGIPTIQDRVVQQAFLQVLQPILGSSFSEHSYGFRPGRSAHQAVSAAQAYIQQGYDWVVDFDLEAFFDRVNHDRLMSRLGQRIADKRVRWIIRRFLQAGVMENEAINPTTEGTPQGGPLSPLLANLVLDELDKELERRGLRFVRYADDCNVYLRSGRAAANAFENLIGFIEGTLKRKVNRAKSAVARPWERKLLGFSFTWGKNAKRRIAPKALAKAKARIRELTKKGRSNFQATMAKLRQYLIGWLGYFRFCQTPSVLGQLEEWTRRRLRCLIWKQWKRGSTRFAELVKRGTDREEAAKLAGSSDGPWHLSRTPVFNQVFPKAWFAAHGLPNFHAPT